MYKVTERYTNIEQARFATKAEAEQFCGKIAYAENYGVMGVYTIEGKTYMDCGPRTFIIEEIA